jgi:hypothetical protein
MQALAAEFGGHFLMINSTCAVGRGKPPVDSRFKEGQSGNPTGNLGPAKLLKQRFQWALN